MSARSTAERQVTSAGLLAGAAGIILMKAGGAEMPAVPPGAVLLVVGAGLVTFVGRRWTAVVAILVALAEVAGIVASGSLGDVADGSALEVVGTAVRCVGVLAALAGGGALLVRRTQGEAVG
jgi:hypothetical protein